MAHVEQEGPVLAGMGLAGIAIEGLEKDGCGLGATETVGLELLTVNLAKVLAPTAVIRRSVSTTQTNLLPSRLVARHGKIRVDKQANRRTGEQAGTKLRPMLGLDTKVLSMSCVAVN